MLGYRLEMPVPSNPSAGSFPADSVSGVEGGVGQQVDDAFAELIHDYARRLPERVADLSAAIQRGEVELARTLLHQTAGAAGGYGFMEVTHAALALERLTVAVGQSTEQSRAMHVLARLAQAAWEDASLAAKPGPS